MTSDHDNRLNRLEEKVDKLIVDLPNIIQGAVGMALKGQRPTNGEASWVRQSIGLTIAVIALIGFMVPTMVAIVKPMQQQIDYVKEYTNENATLMNDWKKVHDERYPPKWLVEKVEELEEWQRWWYRELPKNQAECKGRINAIESDMVEMRELFKIRSENVKKLVQ